PYIIGRDNRDRPKDVCIGGVRAGNYAPLSTVPMLDQRVVRVADSVETYGPDVVCGYRRYSIQHIVRTAAVGAGHAGPIRAIPMHYERLAVGGYSLRAYGPYVVSRDRRYPI